MMHTLDAHFFEALERRAFTERQVMKIHGLKGSFDTKIVYFSQICDNFLSKFFK